MEVQKEKKASWKRKRLVVVQTDFDIKRSVAASLMSSEARR